MPRHFDYERLETALETGAVSSRQEFYEMAGARWSVQRKRLRSGLFPEHRAILDSLPNVTPHRSRQYAARLNKWAVIGIHRDLALGQHPADIAAERGVSRATVYDILAGRTWPHLHPNHQEAS